MEFDEFNSKNDVYLRVVKARDLPARDVTGTCDPFVEVKIGNCKYTTHHFENNLNPVWDQVFTLSKDQILEVIVKDKDVVKDDFIGRVVFDLDAIPNIFSQESSALASQWYSLQDRENVKTKGELMLAIWMTSTIQADDLNAAEPNIGSSIYLSPNLWYLRVNVIEAKDLHLNDESRLPEVSVKVVLGSQVMRTRVSTSKSINPMWNEDLMFVASEPFEDPLVLIVEELIAPSKYEDLGAYVTSLYHVDRRLDHKPVNSKWYNLVPVAGEKKKEVKFGSQIHVRICLEGGYHVLHESTFYSSDLRPTAKQLWKSSIGILELGIINAHGLAPMKTKDERETTDAYCVVKYGQKWVKTKTIIDSLDPIWNEQYHWEVFDPCTVATIAIFDNCHFLGEDTSVKDSSIGIVRIRLSTFETNRTYSHSYPLLVLHPSGVKNMGEIHLTVRFTFSSFINMIHMYSQPLLPKMHYNHPLTPVQLDRLRFQATQVMAIQLSRTEPPLRKEVVEYMLDEGSQLWSIRKNKTNMLRIMGTLSDLIALREWFDEIRNWKNPITTVCIHILLLMFVMSKQYILPTIFLSLFLIIVWYYRRRPQHPFQIDTHLSCVDDVHPEELDEEFDTFPTSRPVDTVRRRYERLRKIGLSYQMMIGDLATHGERAYSLTSWRDPRATIVFGFFCLITAVILCTTPFEVVSIITGFYVLRHPKLRSKVPSMPMNFFRRLPTKTGSIL